MTLFLVALNLALVTLVVVLANLAVVRRRRHIAVSDGDRLMPGGADAPLAALLANLLSADERQVMETARAIARNPGQYEGALVSAMTVARETLPRARLAALWAVRAILKRRPELCTLCEHDPSAAVRAAVVSSITADTDTRGDTPTLRAAALVEAASGDPDVHVRRAAYTNLRLVPSERATSLMWRGLDDDDDDVRRLATVAMIGWVDATNVGRVIDRLSASPPGLARCLLQVLARSDSRVLEPLVRLARESAQPKVQMAALRALGAAGLPMTCTDVLPFLQDASPSLRRTAASAIAEVGRLAAGRGIPVEVVGGLVDQMRREADAHVMLALIDALETSSGEQGVGALLEKVPDLNPALRERALEALAVLQRRPGPVAGPHLRLAAHAS
jgi:HEAT repeat protein